MNIIREISAALANGSPTKMASARKFSYRLRDIERRLALKLSSAGKFAGGFIEIPASGSESLPLPAEYSDSSRLFVFLQADRRVKVVTESPDEPTSTSIIEVANGEVDGVHQVLQTVTSITLTNTNASNKALVRYFLFEMPDITASSAFLGGVNAVGAQTIT